MRGSIEVRKAPPWNISKPYREKGCSEKTDRNAALPQGNRLRKRKDKNRRRLFRISPLGEPRRNGGTPLIRPRAKGSRPKECPKNRQRKRIRSREDIRSWISVLLRSGRNLRRLGFRLRPNRGFQSLKRRLWQWPSILRSRLSRGLLGKFMTKGGHALDPTAGKPFRLPNPIGKNTAEFRPKERSKTLRARRKEPKEEPPGPKAKAGLSRTVRTELRRTRTTNVRKNR